MLSITSQNGWIMATVTIGQVASLQIHQSDEHRDEHTTLIILRQLRIQMVGNVGRHHLLFGQSAEQADGLCHKQRGWYSLATDVAQTKI